MNYREALQLLKATAKEDLETIFIKQAELSGRKYQLDRKQEVMEACIITYDIRIKELDDKIGEVKT